MVFASLVAAASVAAAQPTVSADPLTWNEARAVELAALPLSCLDRPHRPPGGKPYIHESSPALRPDYESTRAFYGCYDWHSAVNSTWTLAEILERFPDSRIAPLIAEKLNQHLTAEALAGEVVYFEENPRFERPYGWAWLLALDAALRRSNHESAQVWIDAVAPLAERFAADLIPYVENLDYPLRVGTHNNTAFALDLTLDYATQMGDIVLAGAVRDSATRLFADDVACPLAYEPSGSDFLSPCLEVAKLMSAVLGDDFAGWLDDYLGDLDGPGFAQLGQPIALRGDNEELDTGQLGAKSHLIGLAFTRAEALERVASALPEGDARVPVLREVATAQATQGFEAMFEADYLGSHWLATFALKYLLVQSPTTP
jgi:hypothetical protein